MAKEQKMKEVERIVDLLWKMRREHIEGRMSSHGKVLDYIDEALGEERIKQALAKAGITEEKKIVKTFTTSLTLSINAPNKDEAWREFEQRLKMGKFEVGSIDIEEE